MSLPSSSGSILPDELVKEILHPLLVLPDSLLLTTSSSSPFATPSQSCSAFLVVCKQWMRVCTPILYESVVIRSTAQAQALQRALKFNPSLGKIIKKLRAEGGFGASMHGILKAASGNVHSIALTLDIWSPDSTAGLVKGLPLLEGLKKLVIIDGSDRPVSQPPTNSAAVKLGECVAECISTHWASLDELYCPYLLVVDIGGTRLRNIFDAISNSPSPGGITVNTLPVVTRAQNLQDLCNMPTVRKLIIRRRHDQRHVMAEVDHVIERALREDQALRKKVEIEEIVDPIPPELARSAPQPLPVAHAAPPPGAANFVPLQHAPEDVQDLVWGRIILFAAEADTDVDLAPAENCKDGTEGIRLCRLRLSLLMVCRRFFRLAEPLLWRDITLYSFKSTVAFAFVLMSHPHKASQVRTLSYHVQSFTSLPSPEMIKVTNKLADIYEAALNELPSSSRSDDARARQKEVDEADWTLRNTKLRDVKKTSIRAFLSETRYFHAALEFIFATCTNLVRLTHNRAHGVWSHRLSSPELFADLALPSWRIISRVDAGQLRMLDVNFKSPGVGGSKFDLSRFVGVRYLHLHSPFQKYGDPVADPGNEDAEGTEEEEEEEEELTFPDLEELVYDDTGDGGSNRKRTDLGPAKELARCRAPRLTHRISIRLPIIFPADEEADGPGYSAALSRMLTTIGPGLEEIRIKDPLNGMMIARQCPGLKTMYLSQIYQLSSGFFQQETTGAHAALERIVIEDSFESLSWPYKTIREEFDSIDLSNLPQFKELRVNACKWPKSERELKKEKNPWVPISERLKDSFGVKLVDRDGVGWIPRLETGKKGR